MVPDRDGDDNAPTDKAWTIHAAIVGVNMGNMLFRGSVVVSIPIQNKLD